MKFDEAIDKIDVNGTLIDILGVLKELQQEYAPTVEMTKFQKGFLLHYLENFSFHEFISDVYMARYSSKEIDLNDKYEHLSDEDLMQAWLHPETIKVVDE